MVCRSFYKNNMIKSGSKMKTKIYYESQTNWTKDEYYIYIVTFIGCYFIMKSIRRK